MKPSLRIGLIGDRDDGVVAHRAIPLALDMACAAAGVACGTTWIGTETIASADTVAGYDGLWCVPASPYRSMDGALTAIRHARERKIPFLGTCGGFQHAMLEYARNVLGWHDAEHAETAPGSARPVIVPLLCSLVEVSDAVRTWSRGHGSRGLTARWISSRATTAVMALAPRFARRWRTNRCRSPRLTTRATCVEWSSATTRSSWQPCSSTNVPPCKAVYRRRWARSCKR